MGSQVRGVLTVKGKTWTFSPLTMGQSRRHGTAMNRLIEAEGNSTVPQRLEKMREMVPLMVESLVEHHPDLTAEQFEEVVTAANFHLFVTAMMDACWPEGVPEPGEAGPAAD